MPESSGSTFKIGGTEVKPGRSARVSLSAARLYDGTEVTIPLKVIRGRQDGPVLFVSAAIHGDEINGVEIIRRLLRQKSLRQIQGTLIAAPLINVFGFNNKSRYLPDRRDLNRCFPGSASGSLAGRIANTFMTEIVARSTHGIDLHTGAIHRCNLPQVRACLDDPETKALAEAFDVPVVIHSDTRDGSLREAARERAMPMLLYEGGEALRFDSMAIRRGLRGILSVMRGIGMLPQPEKSVAKESKTYIAKSTHWVRAPESGVLRIQRRLGNYVKKDSLLGVISDPFGERRISVRAPASGIIIGQLNLPLVNRGDALFHIARFDDVGSLGEHVEEFEQYYDTDVI